MSVRVPEYNLCPLKQQLINGAYSEAVNIYVNSCTGHNRPICGENAELFFLELVVHGNHSALQSQDAKLLLKHLHIRRY
jgi:hypothetical protein